MFLFLILVSGYGSGALAVCWELAASPGEYFVAAAVVGAAAGLAPGMATIYFTAPFPASAPRLLSEEVEGAYADPGS
jgi:hypothetical protein